MKWKTQYFIVSIADMLFLSLLLYISIVQGGKLLSDCDTGYHIRAGEYILNTFSVPHFDIFSFHTPEIPWTAHEWLSEVIMAIIHHYAGLTGVAVFFALIIALVYYLLFKVIRLYGGNIFVVILFVLLAVISSQIHWLARPHMFSLLLMAIWYVILDEYQYRGKDYLYLLPFVMLLWVNLHGGFLGGFILLSIYLLGNLQQYVMCRSKEENSYGQKSRKIALITLLCLLVSLVNPYGYHILMFPFNLVSNKFIMDHVVEFMSANFHDTLVFEYVLLLMIIILAVSRKRLNIIEIMLVVLFTHMALFSVRYIPLFAIVTAPILVRQTESIIGETNSRFVDFFKKRAEGIASIDASARGFLWPFAGALVIISFVATGKISYTFDPKIKPVAAVEFLKKEPVRGNMFNDDEFGDYIDYALWPKYRVFFDGRSDMYGTAKMKEYFKIVNLKPDWEKVLEKYNITWVIYGTHTPLCRFLMERKDWKLIYEDKVADIFVKNIPENKSLIAKYANLKLAPYKDKD
jgi:hypothetical protein